MDVRIFRNSRSDKVPCYREENINAVLSAVASTTDTDKLVVAVYFLARRIDFRGCFINKAVSPKEFSTIGTGGGSAFVRAFPPPSGLPRSFSLIRMMLGTAYNYPIQETDTYGWTMRFFTFESQVAFLFGHELHHFRKYHLDLHPREGEIAANKWALQRAVEEEFPLACRGRETRKKRRKRRKRRVDSAQEERYAALKALPDGTGLRIIRGRAGRGSVGSIVRKIKTPRAGAYRMQVQDSAGQIWYWPMDWLEP